MEMVDAAPIALARTRRGVALLVDRSVTSLRNQLESGDDNDTDTASDTDAAESDDDDRSAALTTTQEESMAEGDARSQSEDYDDASQKQYRKEAAAAGRKATVLQALDLSASMYQPYVRAHSRRVQWADTRLVQGHEAKVAAASAVRGESRRAVLATVTVRARLRQPGAAAGASEPDCA